MLHQPNWRRMSVAFLCFLSAGSLLQSIMIYLSIINAWRELDVVQQSYNALSDVLFGIWIPTIPIHRTLCKGKEDFWQSISHVSSRWTNLLFSAFFISLWIDGVYGLLINASSGFKNFQYWRLRGEAGGLIMLFGMATLILYAALRADRANN